MAIEAYIALPLITMATGTGGLSTTSLPLFTITTHAWTAGSMSADLVLPLFETTTRTRNNAYLDDELPLFTIDASGINGNTADADLELPLFTITSSGYSSTSATASLTLPLFEITQQVSPVVVIYDADGRTYQSNTYALVMNTENGALSEYYNYGFNSFALFNGVYLGAGPDGIFQLYGDDDEGMNIKAKVKTPLLDYGDSHQKRGNDVYVGIDTTGEISVSVYTEDAIENECAPVAAGQTGFNVLKFKTGKGVKGQYYSVLIKNNHGDDFILDKISMVAQSISRIKK